MFTQDVVIATRSGSDFVVRPHTVTSVIPTPHHPETAPLSELLASSIAVGAHELGRGI